MNTTIKRGLTCVFAAVLLASCSTGGDGADTAATTSSSLEGIDSEVIVSDTVADDTPADPAVFCASFRELQVGDMTRTPAELDPIFADMEDNAPQAIEAEVDEFVRALRAVSRAFADYDAASVEADAAKVLESLAPGDRQVLEDITVAYQSGQPAEGPTGVIVSYWRENC